MVVLPQEGAVSIQLSPHVRGHVLSLFTCRAQSFAERLRLGIAVIHGEAQDAESDQVDGRHSPPTVKTTGAIHPSMEIPCKCSTLSKTNPVYEPCETLKLLSFSVLIPKEKPPITVVGDVGGRIAIIVVRNTHSLFIILLKEDGLGSNFKISHHINECIIVDLSSC